MDPIALNGLIITCGRTNGDECKVCLAAYTPQEVGGVFCLCLYIDPKTNVSIDYVEWI